MTFVSVTNMLLMLLCVGVLVQSVRLMRSVRAMRSSDLGDTVKHLDRATDQAREVLAELKRVLSADGQANVRALSSAEALRDELSLMVGIGNAVAERIMEAAEAAKDSGRKEAPAPEPKPAAAKRARSRSRARGGAKAAEKADAKAKDAVLAAVPVQPSASVALLPHLSKAA